MDEKIINSDGNNVAKLVEIGNGHMPEKEEIVRGSQIVRNNKGQFVKGHCPNPGSKKQGLEEFRKLAVNHCEEAILTIIDLMRHAQNSRIRLEAAKEIVARTMGRIPQSIDLNMGRKEDEPITIEHICRLLSSDSNTKPD